MIETLEQSVAPVGFQEAHADYIAHGGKFNLNSFRFIITFTRSEEVDILLSGQSYRRRMLQANCLGESTCIPLSVEEKQLYALLRDQQFTDKLTDVAGEQSPDMSDQQLLAEIFRITFPEIMHLFMSQFPQIFRQ